MLISTPTSMIVGEWDFADLHTIADTLEQNIPNAQNIALSSAGHMANMEYPDGFNGAFLRFLANRLA